MALGLLIDGYACLILRLKMWEFIDESHPTLGCSRWVQSSLTTPTRAFLP